MGLPDLKRLWRGCAALTLCAGVFLAYLHACERSARPPVAPAVTPAAPPAPSHPDTGLAEPRYTYVGPAQLAENANRSGDDIGAPKPRPGKPRRPAEAATDSLLALGRQAQNFAALGDVPDLDIRLAGVDLQQVMLKYGYVPAIKTRARLLGKIAGAQFVPLTAAEISRYARRGRSGAGHPQAQTWLRRVAAELRLPLDELQFIFLVPHATEQIFVAAAMAAIQRAGQSPENIALVRAHFQPDLTISIDALITKTGKTVLLDSLRATKPEHDF